jgi:hypothetical protein
MPGALLFHHCIPLDQVRFCTLLPDRKYSNKNFLSAYEWFEEEIGFYPFFFSVGMSEAGIAMTGYDDNWRVRGGREFPDGTYDMVYRRQGEFPNLVLFSFADLEGVFMDYVKWHIALNACMGGRKVTGTDMKMIFKPSWSRSRWLQAARNGTHDIQLAAPKLPLDQATRIWVRNTRTREILLSRGFRDPEVKRVLV